MIKNIFIPEKIKSYYIIPQRIIGFDFGKNMIYATVIKAQAHKKMIEQCREEPLIIDQNLEYDERVAETIKKVINEIGHIDKVYSAFPSFLTIIKELEIPFKGLQKIKMVLPFEIEPLLPFPLQQAIIDCIIIASDKNTTHILAAAVKRSALEEHQDLFVKAGIEPEKITIDLFELYGFYTSIPSYADLQGTIALIDLQMHVSRLLIIRNTQLIGLRTISKGILSIIKNIQENTSEQSPTVEQIMRFGFQNISSQLLEPFFTEIQFSLQAALSKKEGYVVYDKVLISGVAAQIPDIEKTFTTFLSIDSEIFNLRKIIHNNTVQAQTNLAIPPSCAVSLATALSSPLTDSFNLSFFQHMNNSEKKLMFHQVIVALFLIIFLISGIGIYSFISLKKIAHEAQNSEQQALTLLKREFTLPVIRKKADIGKTLDDALKAASTELNKKQSLWFSLSAYNRASIVKDLSELSGRINRESLGLILKKLTIKVDPVQGKDTLTLEGSVKDYPALNLFEEELRQSHLFKNVPKLQDLKFNLILEKSGQT